MVGESGKDGKVLLDLKGQNSYQYEITKAKMERKYSMHIFALQEAFERELHRHYSGKMCVGYAAACARNGGQHMGSNVAAAAAAGKGLKS